MQIRESAFCKGKIPRLKLCKTCRVPFVPDADVGTDNLTAEGCGAWSCVQGLAAVKRHGQVCADGSLGGLIRIGVDAAGQIDGQHEYTINRKADVTPLVWLTPKIRSDARRKGLRLASSDKTRKRCRT